MFSPRLRTRVFCTLTVLYALTLDVRLSSAATQDWTIMVFINAKNDLECAGINNFLQMAEVGSSERVNIIVELGRPAKVRHTHDEGDWTGVLRFRVTKGMHPVPGSAIEPENESVRNADMGSGATLGDFVQWAELSYPAKKYMLVIWNHGQGWRLYQTERTRARTIDVAYKGTSNQDDISSPCSSPTQQTLTGGFRSVSFDDDTKHFLYNRDIQESLRGQHLEILGFDACLMAMMESAYAFRNIAAVMVASEELVPNDGWKYDSWMKDIVDHPGIDGMQLAKHLVQSYKETYADSGSTTLSAINLSRIEAARQGLSKLSLMVQGRMAEEAAPLAFARLSFRTFGDWYPDSWQDCNGSKIVRFHGIDLIQFLRSYRRLTRDENIKLEIVKFIKQLESALISSYASSTSAGPGHWSSGISIYFPSSILDFQCDPDKEGYQIDAVRAGRVKFPPEFVEKKGWADLINGYLQFQEAAQPQVDQ
jgi:Clostripain family